MDDTAPRDVTRLLNQWQQGDRCSFDELSGVIYSELHRIAQRYLRDSPSATLQPTALINEAYIRLIGVQDPFQGRKHFFALAAKVMRQILVDHARRNDSAKRGGGFQLETLNEDGHGRTVGMDQFLMLDQALTRLAKEEPRLAELVELYYFGGLKGPEISDLLGVPLWTVNRDHRFAAAWLRRELSQA
jgi:RNA polymerase sigma factor (TIGR02999 family)